MHTFFLVWMALLMITGGGPQSGDWKLIWQDEFEYSGLPDTTRWGYDIGDGCPDLCGWGNNELQYYTHRREENARVADGTLIIEARKEPYRSRGYTSARLVTRGKANWRYGRFEIRARLPSGKGTWPAIWMLPVENSYGGWPRSGEIDIMEHVGHEPRRIYGTVHTEAYNHMIGTQKTDTARVADAESSFHLYSLEWTPNEIRWFVDGELFGSFENEHKSYRQWPFDQPFYLIINIAVGGNWGGAEGVDETIWPQQLEIDYVRILQKN
ncbi:MAG: glycoside hydrolase family 16 protein [Balneolaceae bacterium]|nr:glycoside hydrolase family 16 protein [Balneolaceae bacterium]